MKVALLHNHYDVKKLEQVKSEMLKMGAPIINAVRMDCYDCYAAIDGCHRLRAAHELGIEPIINEIEYSEQDIESLGFDSDDFGGENWALNDLVDDANTRLILEF